MANTKINEHKLMAMGQKVTGMKSGGKACGPKKYAKGGKVHTDEAQDRALFNKMMAEKRGKAPMRKASGGMAKGKSNC
jgi:hypothetical protein